MTQRSDWLLQCKAGVFFVWRETAASPNFHVTNDKHGAVLATRSNVNDAFNLATQWNADGYNPDAAPPPLPPAPAVPSPPPPPPAPAPAPAARPPGKVSRPMGQRGQGRKALYKGEPTQSKGVRLTPAQLVKLEALGGVPWLRAMIDKAKLPA